MVLEADCIILGHSCSVFHCSFTFFSKFYC